MKHTVLEIRTQPVVAKSVASKSRPLRLPVELVPSQVLNPVVGWKSVANYYVVSTAPLNLAPLQRYWPSDSAQKKEYDTSTVDFCRCTKECLYHTVIIACNKFATP